MSVIVQSKNPTVGKWKTPTYSFDVWVVKISDVGDDFKSFLQGQTVPYISDEKDPTGWAYYVDYVRWKRMSGLEDGGEYSE